ncbi:MAG: archaetidylserine decarboxylase [bacterium]|nr:phosphatidylserine decarboxylase [Myxococcales bacterium]MCB9550722.1 phosphatidylserine decarboxylase [Myxococcales bacterium]
MKDALLIGTLGLIPKNLLSRAVGAAAHAGLPEPVTRASVRWFARRYGIDLDEAEHPIEHYRTIGELFTRRLKPGARPIDRRPGVAVSPADGRISNSGRIEGGRLIQAKGRDYTVADLLRDRHDAERFENGAWVTVYLSPRDYHRVHHPVEGRITASRYIPGHLWPVNAAAVERVEDLFCVNERVVTFVDSPIGEVASVMVGATSVGHMTMTYDVEVLTNRGRPAALKSYPDGLRIARGDELGMFRLGSTVVVLFADPDVEIEPLAEDQPVRMGQIIARRRSA